MRETLAIHWFRQDCRWWLHESLQSLNASPGGALSLYRGNPLDIFNDIIAHHKVSAVFWNRYYELWRTECDTDIKRQLTTRGIAVESTRGR